ncbi:ATP-binding protein [Chloroflexi bacterium TSY]|nr:ATP-binding protein [Chloroflexi bacterium TSY]
MCYQIRAIPQQITPFIGREKELAELTQLLAEPACQLLTLVGPGGIGKTRLATAAGAHTVADDVYFVALQPVQNHQDLLLRLPPRFIFH